MFFACLFLFFGFLFISLVSGFGVFGLLGLGVGFWHLCFLFFVFSGCAFTKFPAVDGSRRMGQSEDKLCVIVGLMIANPLRYVMTWMLIDSESIVLGLLVWLDCYRWVVFPVVWYSLEDS